MTKFTFSNKAWPCISQKSGGFQHRQGKGATGCSSKPTLPYRIYKLLLSNKFKAHWSFNTTSLWLIEPVTTHPSTGRWSGHPHQSWDFESEDCIKLSHDFFTTSCSAQLWKQPRNLIWLIPTVRTTVWWEPATIAGIRKPSEGLLLHCSAEERNRQASHKLNHARHRWQVFCRLHVGTTESVGPCLLIPSSSPPTPVNTEMAGMAWLRDLETHYLQCGPNQILWL